MKKYILFLYAIIALMSATSSVYANDDATMNDDGMMNDGMMDEGQNDDDAESDEEVVPE